MNTNNRQMILASIASLMAILLALFLTNRDVAKDPVAPRDADALAAWLARHPADWPAATALSDSALDSSLARRAQVWRASYALARHLAPRLRNPPAAFVRGGLFHWYELNDADRKAVLDVAAPLMRDPEIFTDLHRPLWELTHDFDYLRRNAPRTREALGSLRAIAAANGLFAQYREAREALERQRLAEFERTHASIAPHEFPSLLPPRMTTSVEPLLVRILQELLRESFTPSRFGEPTAAMIDYAVSHHLQPLSGLAPFVDAANVIPDFTRARLALALDKPNTASEIELGSANATAAEWIPYHLERALFDARHGEAATSDAQLRRAAVYGLDAEVLSVADQCATILGNESAAAQFRRQLAAETKRPRTWSDTCGANELCQRARTEIHSNGSIEIDASVVQSDQIAPYVEIFADDALVAEGEVANERRFILPLVPGVYRIEVRLVNPLIGNGSQRRVRLS